MSDAKTFRGAAPAPSGAQVGIVLGDRSEAELFETALDLLDGLEVPWEMTVASLASTPERAIAWAKAAQGRGLRVVLATTSGAEPLAAVIAALTPLPVLAVPAAGGAAQAALLAGRILALADEALASRLARHALEQARAALASDDELQAELRQRREAREKQQRARPW